ncbi:MAG: ABC transporter permease [Deltaproteobacteria bacterium]|nr:ABC transporter permease [Deltaproteobacteria bacterium]
MTNRPFWLAYPLALLFFFSLWKGVSIIAGPVVVPGPVETIQALADEIRTKEYWAHFAISAYRIGMSLWLAFITAVPLGLALGGSRRADRAAAPFINLSYPIPKIVFLPLVLLLFGLGDLSKIVLVAVVVFFQLLITTRDAARLITKEMRYSMKSLGANRRDFFVHVIWPFCLPGIFTSLRIGIGTAIAVLFFVESIGTRRGLGLYILDAWGMANYTIMYVGIISLSGLGIFIYEIFDILERHYCHWKNV